LPPERSRSCFSAASRSDHHLQLRDGGPPDAAQTAFIDLAVVVTTAVAYVLCRGWSSWRTGIFEPAGDRRPAD
jgi:hypothetical protein